MAATKVTLRSSNTKTGPMTTTSRTHDSCPSACPFYGNGCYAESGPGGGPFSIAARMGTDDETGAVAAMVTDVPSGRPVRWNVSGDIVRADGESLDHEFIALVDGYHAARPDSAGILYSHAWRGVRQPFANLNANASCESPADVEAARALGWQTVMVVGDEASVPKGKGWARCPAETRKEINCSTCMLCSKERSSTVVFVAHGNGKRKVREVLANANGVEIMRGHDYTPETGEDIVYDPVGEVPFPVSDEQTVTFQEGTQ